MFMSRTQTKEAELFAHVSWITLTRKPILACDEMRQAAYEAVKTCTRSHLCRVLAIGGSDTQIHLIVSFPASLPVSQIARISMQASSDSISQLYLMLHAHRMDTNYVWDRNFTAQTLGPIEAADAQAFLQKQITSSVDR